MLGSCDWFGLDWTGLIGLTDVAEKGDVALQPLDSESRCVEGAVRGMVAPLLLCLLGHGGLLDRFAVFRLPFRFSEALRALLGPSSVTVQCWMQALT